MRPHSDSYVHSSRERNHTVEVSNFSVVTRLSITENINIVMRKGQAHLPVLSLRGNAKFFDLTLDRGERFCCYAEVEQLGFDELVQVFNWLGLKQMVRYSSLFKPGMDTHVLENGLHQRNCHLGLLDQVIFCVLNFQTSLFLFGRTGVFEPMENLPHSQRGEKGKLTPASQHPTPICYL